MIDGDEDERAVRLARLRAGVDTWFGAHGADERQAAMVETAFLMAAADGKIQPAEYEELVGTIARVTGDRLGLDRIRIIASHLTELLSLEGWEARVVAVAQALDTMAARRSAYMLAAGVSFIDGEVQAEEVQLFGMLADGFGIPIPEAEVLLRDVHRSIFDTGPELTDPVLMLTKLRGH